MLTRCVAWVTSAGSTRVTSPLAQMLSAWNRARHWRHARLELRDRGQLGHRATRSGMSVDEARRLDRTTMARSSDSPQRRDQARRRRPDATVVRPSCSRPSTRSASTASVPTSWSTFTNRSAAHRPDQRDPGSAGVRSRGPAGSTLGRHCRRHRSAELITMLVRSALRPSRQ